MSDVHTSFDRDASINKIKGLIEKLSDTNLKKLIDLDLNTELEVNETVAQTNFIAVREMTDKTRKAIDEAIASGTVGPFDTVDEALDWLFNKSEEWEKSQG